MKRLAIFLVSLVLGFMTASGQAVNPGCDYWVPRDGTWQIVPFTIGTQTDDYRNDDGSSPLIVIPFNFCLYGVQYDSLYINNNGNISFITSYSTYSANGFPDGTHAMVAPFWGDVDTRGTLSGIVYYQVNATNLIVQWDSVGYFNSHDDKRNTFQLIITDGNDPIVPLGKNVSFYYEDMQWTTGDASGGAGGFGGTAATAGINRGNGVDYIQIGTFDHAGINYDGPYGAADGISFLDYTYFAIDACFSNANVPPIATSPNACDTVYVCAGDTFFLSANYLSPEPNQITTPSFNANGIGGATVLSSTSGNVASISVQIVTQITSPGFYPVSLLGIDDGIPSDTTYVNVVVDVLPSATANFSAPPYACEGDTVTLSYTGTALGTTTYAWNFGSINVLSGSGSGPYILQLNSTGIDSISLVVNGQNGCGDSLTSAIQVDPVPVAFFTAPPAQCIEGNHFRFSAGGVLIPGTQYSWNFGSNATPASSISSIQDSVSYSTTGSHVVELNASFNACQSLPFIDTVKIYTSPVAFFSAGQTTGCTPLDVPFSNFSTGENNSYLWNFNDGTTDTDSVPVHEFKIPGTYTVSLTATTIHGCVADTAYTDLVIANPTPVAEFTPTPSEVPIYAPLVNFVNTSSGGNQYSWDFGDGLLSSDYRPEHSYADTGTYTVMLIVANLYGCIDTVLGYARVEPEFTFYVPAAFTPNGDGKNDIFVPYATSIEPVNYHMRIFDRWGTEIFSSDNILVGWNGRSVSNIIVPSGTYVYQLEFTDNQNATHTLTGKVSVFN